MSGATKRMQRDWRTAGRKTRRRLSKQQRRAFVYVRKAQREQRRAIGGAK